MIIIIQPLSLARSCVLLLVLSAVCAAAPFAVHSPKERRAGSSSDNTIKPVGFKLYPPQISHKKPKARSANYVSPNDDLSMFFGNTRFFTREDSQKKKIIQMEKLERYPRSLVPFAHVHFHTHSFTLASSSSSTQTPPLYQRILRIEPQSNQIDVFNQVMELLLQQNPTEYIYKPVEGKEGYWAELSLALSNYDEYKVKYPQGNFKSLVSEQPTRAPQNAGRTPKGKETGINTDSEQNVPGDTISQGKKRKTDQEGIEVKAQKGQTGERVSRTGEDGGQRNQKHDVQFLLNR